MVEVSVNGPYLLVARLAYIMYSYIMYSHDAYMMFTVYMYLVCDIE